MCELENVKCVLQASPVPSLIIDTHDNLFTIVGVNDSFSLTTKIAATDIEGKYAEDLFVFVRSLEAAVKGTISDCLQHVMLNKVSLKVVLSWLEQIQDKTSTEDLDFFNCDFYPLTNRTGELKFIIQQFPEAISGAMKVAEKTTHEDHLSKKLMLELYSSSELESERLKYKDLFNLSPLPQFLYDLDSLNFLDVNAAALTEYGYTKEEFLTMSLFDIRPAEDREFLKTLLKDQVVKGRSNSSNVRHVKKDGTIMNVTVRGNSVCYNHKNVRLAVIVDHTEKIRALEALELSENRFKSLVQEGSDLIAIISPEGVYKYVNPNSLSILGIESGLFIGKNVFDFIHEEDRDTIAQYLNVIADHKRLQLPAFRFLIGNNECRWIETIITNMVTDPGIAGLIANSRDVTERINNEAKVRESIERFGIVSKATSDAIWDWDMKNDSMVWNKGLHGIFGYNMDQTSHQWWYDQIQEQDLERVKNEIHALIFNKISRLELEYCFKDNEGKYKNVLDRSFLIFNDLGEPVRMIGSMQDITERTTNLKEIQDQNARLREISWMQSHNVRAPLARIMALTSLMACGGMDETSDRQSLDYLIDSATELNDIIYKIIKKTEGRSYS